MKDSPLWLQIWLQDITRKWGKIQDLDFLRDRRNSNNSCPQDIGCSLNILHPCLAGTFCSHRNQTCESASSPTLTRARCWVKPKSKFLNNASASSTTFVTNSQFCLRFLKTLHPPKFVRNPKSSYLEDICYSFLADFLSGGRIWAGQENDGKSYSVVLPRHQKTQRKTQSDHWSPFLVSLALSRCMIDTLKVYALLPQHLKTGAESPQLLLTPGLLAFKGGSASVHKEHSDQSAIMTSLISIPFALYFRIPSGRGSYPP